MRKRKTHLQDKSVEEPRPVCGAALGVKGKTTHNLPDVDCGNCLRLAGNKTTEQGGPLEVAEEMVNVVLVSTGPNFINCIKEVRSLCSGFGLCEAKQFCDKVRDTGRQVLLSSVARSNALDVAKRFQAIGAEVVLDSPSTEDETFTGTCPTCGQEDLSRIKQAYDEMLALFFPLQVVDRNKALDDMDDDDRTGHRPWPVRTSAKIADIRRWLEAGGEQK